MRFILLVLFAAGAWLPAPARAQSPDTELAVISYNVQFLPGLASAANKRKQPEYRAQRIAEEVSAFDIVALQETFHEEHRTLLIKALQKTGTVPSGARPRAETGLSPFFDLVVAPKPDGFYANGGTLITARYPIVESHAFVYTKFSTPEQYGISADGYSAKGVIHAQLQLPGNQLLDVFNTHLEAREPDFRPSQYRELADLIADHGDTTIPALLFGDMNTNGIKPERDNPDSPYNRFLNELQRARPGTAIVDLWPAIHPEALGGTSEQETTETGKRIDYIIALQPAGNDTALTASSIHVDPYPDDEVTYLSDHSAVVAHLKLNR